MQKAGDHPAFYRKPVAAVCVSDVAWVFLGTASIGRTQALFLILPDLAVCCLVTETTGADYAAFALVEVFGLLPIFDRTQPAPPNVAPIATPTPIVASIGTAANHSK